MRLRLCIIGMICLAASSVRAEEFDAGRAFAAMAGGVQADEDRLPVAPESFDLVVSAGVLDSVNDVPGALAQIRRALRPSTSKSISAPTDGPTRSLQSSGRNT